MPGFDWDAAAKRDYVRKYGAEPHWLDLRPVRDVDVIDTSVAESVWDSITSRALILFALLRDVPAGERAQLAESYRNRIRRVCSQERIALGNDSRSYLEDLIARLQEFALTELRVIEREEPDSRAGE